MCKTETDLQNQKYTAHCYVNHSINTLPMFSCPQESAPATIDVHHREMEVEVTGCANDKTRYNVTTFSVDGSDTDEELTCNVKYTTVDNSSDVFFEERFVVFLRANKTQQKYENISEETRQGDKKTRRQGGKYNVFLTFVLTAGIQVLSIKFAQQHKGHRIYVM